MLYIKNVRSNTITLAKILNLGGTISLVGFLLSEIVTAVKGKAGMPAYEAFEEVLAGKTKITVAGKQIETVAFLARLKVILEEPQFEEDYSVQLGCNRTGGYLVARVMEINTNVGFLPVQFIEQKDATRLAILDNTKHAFASDFVLPEILDMAVTCHKNKEVKTGEEIQKRFGLKRNKSIVAYCVARLVNEKKVSLDRLIPLKLAQTTAQDLWNSYKESKEVGAAKLKAMETGTDGKAVKAMTKKSQSEIAEDTETNIIVSCTLKAVGVNDSVAMADLNHALRDVKLPEEVQETIQAIIADIK